MAINQVQTNYNKFCIYLYESSANSGYEKIRQCVFQTYFCKTRLSRLFNVVTLTNLYFTTSTTIVTVACAQKHFLTAEMHKTTGFQTKTCSAHRIYHQKLFDSWNRNAFYLQCQHRIPRNVSYIASHIKTTVSADSARLHTEKTSFSCLAAAESIRAKHRHGEARQML